MSFGSKNCLHCGTPIELKVRRDLDRKKYCSRSCRQKRRYIEEPAFRKRLEAARLKSNTPEAKLKKIRKDPANGRYKTNREEVKYRLRPETNAFKAAVLFRDRHKCVWCGATEKLVVDHIKPYAAYPELRYEPDNGRTLCVPCHKKTDTYGAKTTKLKKELERAPIQK